MKTFKKDVNSFFMSSKTKFWRRHIKNSHEFFMQEKTAVFSQFRSSTELLMLFFNKLFWLDLGKYPQFNPLFR